MLSVLVSSFLPADYSRQSTDCGWMGGGIYSVAINDEQTVITRLAACSFPHFFTVDHKRQILWTNDSPTFDEGEEFIVGFQQQADGSWQECARIASCGQAPCHIAAADAWVFAANYSSGNVVRWTVGPDGSLNHPSVQQHQGSGIHPIRQKSPHAHCIRPVPNSNRVMAADLGADRIYVYENTQSNLEPRVRETLTVPPGSGPRHLEFASDGRHLYVINELSNCVTHFIRDANTETWHAGITAFTVPADFDGTSFCADLSLTECGRFLFASNRGHNSIACFTLGADGTPSRQEVISSGGVGPQNLQLSNNQQELCVANMKDNSIALFQIGSIGRLNRMRQFDFPAPSCLSNPIGREY